MLTRGPPSSTPTCRQGTFVSLSSISLASCCTQPDEVHRQSGSLVLNLSACDEIRVGQSERTMPRMYYDDGAMPHDGSGPTTRANWSPYVRLRTLRFPSRSDLARSCFSSFFSSGSDIHRPRPPLRRTTTAVRCSRSRAKTMSCARRTPVCRPVTTS